MSNDSVPASAVGSLPPCGGGLGRGVLQIQAAFAATPLPSPPPQGGREQTVPRAQAALRSTVRPRVMIPVTTFAGKKVAVFGLGGSGLASASALLAGGADVIGWDDNADTVAKATSAGIPTADLRDIDWSRIAALRAGARRAAHASGAALAGRLCARQRGRGDRRHRAVLPRAPRACAGRAVRGDHRHQRQVDHHRADRASPGRGRLRRPARRQYRHRDPVARAARAPAACM